MNEVEAIVEVANKSRCEVEVVNEVEAVVEGANEVEVVNVVGHRGR